MADICSFFAQTFVTLPAPDSLGGVIWNARGNKGSCQAQGFFIFLGSIGAPSLQLLDVRILLHCLDLQERQNPGCLYRGKDIILPACITYLCGFDWGNHHTLNGCISSKYDVMLRWE